MRKAFLSHSSADKDFVRPIAKALGDCCVFDEMTFEAGMPILDEIMKGMDSSDLFVLFLSENALNSPWVKKEISQAEKMSGDNLGKILPVIIDKSVKYSDKRIPLWLQQSYNIKPIFNTNIVLSKIHNRLRKLRLQENAADHGQQYLFVGRNKEIAKFEQEINNLDMWVPTYVVAYNFIAGMGRRSFLKNALRKVNYLEMFQEPISISLNDKESIENFIYKLSSIKGDQESLGTDLSVMSMSDKVALAANIVKSFIDSRETIFIIDDGGIVQPNHEIARWFSDMVNLPEFNNRLAFCIASHYRPHPQSGAKKSLLYNICELSPAETQTLFVKLLSANNIESLSREEKARILSVLNGVPAQVKMAVEWLKSGYNYALNHIDEIRQYSDAHTSIILLQFKTDDIAYQIMLFLSMEDLMSYDVLKDVFGDGNEVYEALSTLQELSCISDMFEGSCLRLNPTMRDYILRSHRTLADKYAQRYAEVIQTYKQSDLEALLKDDYTKFMIVINDHVTHGRRIPQKFFMPSLLLSYIINEYNKGNYQRVIEMCEQLLTYSNYDPEIVWATKYRLTIAYARTRNEQKFNENVKYFKEHSPIDFYFLLGFFYRIIGKHRTALEHIDHALRIKPGHSASLREKVNTLLALEDYDTAVDLAENNYKRHQHDIIHAHSYFKALICSSKLQPNKDKECLQNIMEMVGANSDPRAYDLKSCMEGEYEYYINNDLTKAIKILQTASQNNNNKIYAQKALHRIYSRAGMKSERVALEREMASSM